MRTKRPLTILFDANPIASSAKSGVGYYATYLVQSIAEQYPDVQLIGHYYDFLGRKHPTLPSAPNIRYRPTKLFPGKVTNMLRRIGISVPLEVLAWHRADILLFPNFLTQPSLFRKPIVTVIHDLCFVRYPEYIKALNLHDLRRYVPQSIRRSTVFIANSDFTKDEIIDVYHVPAAQIVTVPIPPLRITHVSPTKAATIVRQLGITKPYIFFIGNLEPRKNLEALVDAYAQLPAALRQEYGLVLAGGKGWKNTELIARVEELQKKGATIIMPGYVSDEQRGALYQQATLVTMPSHYEGFGMPISEAFEFHKPAAVSDIPIHREIGRDAVAYFDPTDTQSIARVLKRLLEDEKLQEQLVARAAALLKQYSWSENASRIMDKIEGAL